MKTKALIGIGIVVALLPLLWLTGGVLATPAAQRSHEAELQGDVSLTAALSSKISYQGVLRENGQPVSGSRNMVFRLYSNPACSAQVGGNIVKSSVPVAGGRFTVDLDVNHRDFDGQALWLEVEVAGTRIGCEEILPVPYALSLRPGAHIAGSVTASPYAALHVWNTATSGSAYGVKGGTDSPSGRAVYGDALHGGTGVYAKSDTGVAIKAAGTGVIQSSAKSYVWISGNDLRKKYSTDSTQFELDLYGGVKVRRGTDGGVTRDVMLPVTLPGQLYGQNVTLTGIDVYFRSQSDFDGIGGTFVRRQSEAGSGDLILRDDTDRACPPGTACSYHLDLTQNNVLSDERGVVYIAFQLFFAGADTYVQIGGVRLTLEHD